MSAQRVRVVIEGTHYPIVGGDPLLRLRTDEGTLVYLPARDRGVTVENIVPPRRLSGRSHKWRRV